jgi:TetR/AcrR family transcriptional repressor of nem operon
MYSNSFRRDLDAGNKKRDLAAKALHKTSWRAPHMRYDTEHKERTRLRLLTEAAIMLREEGPHGLSVATLMKRQGLTHGGFYAHFASKDDLIAQAIDVMFERTCERFQIRTRGLEPQAALLAYINYYLSPAHYNKPGQGCAIPATAGDVARLEPEARKRFEIGVTTLQRLIAGQFRLMDFSLDEAMDQAAALLADMSGAVIMARAVKSPVMQKHITGAAQAAILARLRIHQPDFGLETEADAAVTPEKTSRARPARKVVLRAG